MKNRYNKFNPKHKIKTSTKEEMESYSEQAKLIRYGGNPEHKKNPGDFGLTPPSNPRSAKSLCDSAGVFSKKEALKYLQIGFQKGLISERFIGIWPQNIWAGTNDGYPLEAQLENSVTGTYHGYPIDKISAWGAEIIRLWNKL